MDTLKPRKMYYLYLKDVVEDCFQGYADDCRKRSVKWYNLDLFLYLMNANQASKQANTSPHHHDDINNHALGIKRWTDGLVWSPSRILGNFLIYRELDKRASGSGKRGSISASNSSNNSNGNGNDARQRSFSADHGTTTSSTVAAAGGVMSIDRNRERQLVGSLSDSYKFRKDGLIKKTMSIVVNGVSQHLISYYHPQDVLNNRLRTPSSVPELASLEISPELLVRQNFRIPPMIEPTFDHPGEATGAIPMPDGSNGAASGGGGGTVVAAAAAAAMSAFGGR